MIFYAFMIAAAAVSVWAGFQDYTPADFDHFEVDHHDNKDGEMTWHTK